MPVTRAMLMAAGLGTRLKPFTESFPKALMPLMGIPVAQFALDSIRDSGVELVVANVHHHARIAKDGLLRLERGPMEMRISDESARLLGSAGGLKKACSHFGNERFFLVNADVLCGIDLRALAAAHLRARAAFGATMTLAVFPKPPEHGSYREIFLDHDTGMVSGFSEGLREGRPFFIGSAVIEPEALDPLPEDSPCEFVPSILEPAIRAKKAAFFLTEGLWRDVGTPAHWLDAHMYLIEGMETGKLPMRWLRRLDRENTRVASEVWAANDAVKAAKFCRDHAGLVGPCYFSGQEGLEAIGPYCALYGASPAGKIAYGVGFGGAWVGGLNPN